jgi:hypothetical protein
MLKKIHYYGGSEYELESAFAAGRMRSTADDSGTEGGYGQSG